MSAVDVQQGLQEFYSSGATGDGRSRVFDARLLGSGFETDVYAFSLAAAGAGEAQELVLRVYAGEGAAEKSAREFAAMGRLRDAGYPVPRVLVLERERSAFGRPFLVMERIHGEPLWSVDTSGSEERRRELLVLHYRLMAGLHALDGPAILPDSPLAGSRDPFACVDHELSLLSGLIGRLEGREPPSLRAALAWLGARRSEVPCERPVVVHGDFHRNNVLLRDDGAAFVIDWSNIRLADYRTDLAWNRLLIQADRQPDGGAAELQEYERLAGGEVSKIELFEVIACTRLLSSVLISLQFGAARQGMRPGAEAVMRRASDHTRYVAALLQKRTGLPMSDLDEALSALMR